MAPLLVLLQALTAAAGVWGMLRATRLRAIADDPRLRRLAWFFGLMASASALDTLLTAYAGGSGAMAAGIRQKGIPALEVAVHLVSLCAFALALRTFQRPWVVHTDTPRAPAWLAWAIISATAIEALVALYLAVGSLVNHVRLRRAGSLRVAVAFLLLALGLVARWLLPGTGAWERVASESLALAGIALLASHVPRRP